jgi:gamma-D-glutamyl-L-lysine dipeptidyl-peptidase
MIEAVRVALDEAVAAFLDSRIHYCKVEAGGLSEGRCTLTGLVLDRATLDALVLRVSERVPGAVLDVSGVRVLRSLPPHAATVATNLTGLYAGPSFLDEQISQLLGGGCVELLFEEGSWQFIRLPDGYLGWAYGPYLSGEEACVVTHLVAVPESPVLERPGEGAPLLTRVLGGTAVAVDAADGEWRHLALPGAGHSGWVRADALRSFAELPGAATTRRDQMVSDALRFIGVPYLWGGCTAYGIDCSGLVQLLHRLSGLTLPRDADMQLDAGRPVEAPCDAGDLLFFGEMGTRRKITHVALSLGGWRIIHSSRSRNGVYIDDVQAVPHLRESLVAAASYA